MHQRCPAIQLVVPAVERILWIEGDWFADGAMDADTYLRRCPMTRHVLDADAPFFWSKIPTAAGERYRVHPAPRRRDVHGLQVPVFGRTGLVGAISLGGTRIDSGATARMLLPVLAVAAFRAAERLLMQPVAADSVLLSEREREILRWTASGRRHRDIADTLNLSGRTVESHLRRIRAKSGVHTIAQAVHVATRGGALEG